MATGLEQSSAKIYRFPVGGRRARFEQSRTLDAERQSTPERPAMQFDWDASYHADAIAEDEARRRTGPKTS